MKFPSGRPGHPTSIHRRLLNRRRDQRGITLIETIIGMVITSMVLLPSLGFVTLTMGEQAAARTLTQETSNVAAADLALVRDVSNAKTAASSTTDTGLQRAPGQLRDCPAAPDTGAGGSVVLALVTSKNYRVVYSLAPVGPNPQLGQSLWRRTCPNQSSTSDATLGDPTELNSPDTAVTEGALLAQRLGGATSSCPAGDGQQDLNCREVVLRLQSVDKSPAGTDRAPVVIQATRRNTSYAAPNTPPNARFTWTPHQVEEGDVVDFDAAGSNDPPRWLADLQVELWCAAQHQQSKLQRCAGHHPEDHPVSTDGRSATTDGGDADRAELGRAGGYRDPHGGPAGQAPDRFGVAGATDRQDPEPGSDLYAHPADLLRGHHRLGHLGLG